MNAIDFLTKEHNRVREALADINDSSHHYDTKRKLFKALGAELIRHETMEHTVWYPHLKKNNHLNETISHLLSEENHAEKAIKQLAEIKTESAWQDHFLQFKKNVEHHAKEEETELFPQVKKLLAPEDLDKIGAEMYQFKKQYHH